MAQVELIVGFISILVVLLGSVYKIAKKITSLEKNLGNVRTNLEARIEDVRMGLEARVEGLGSEIRRLREASIASTSYLASF